ncbi:hypothetical protein BGW38_007733, partial [Lunasporangiospora selenospora]
TEPLEEEDAEELEEAVLEEVGVSNRGWDRGSVDVSVGEPWSAMVLDLPRFFHEFGQHVFGLARRPGGGGRSGDIEAELVEVRADRERSICICARYISNLLVGVGGGDGDGDGSGPIMV